MNRRKFITAAGGGILAAGTVSYLASDRRNYTRADVPPAGPDATFRRDEERILSLASLAPSGHNTQPWFVRYVEPYHWIVGNDSGKWLPAVDPLQRETVLSIGAFIQNLDYAAAAAGYACAWKLLAATNQDEHVAEVRLTGREPVAAFDTAKITGRRTVRSGYSSDELRPDDLAYIVGPDSAWAHYLPGASERGQAVGEQTVEANVLQSRRDPAQRELADWVRFSSRDAEAHRDGLTTAGMEIDGAAAWAVRNFYGKGDVMTDDFRARGVDKVRKQVSESAGWILLTSDGDSVSALLDAGRRMQRLFLRVRDRSIAVHPMTQILEEPSTRRELGGSVGIRESVQFILRAGYLATYPAPVSLRRPVAWFVRQ